MTSTWTLQVIQADRNPREFEARDGLVIGSHIDCGLVLMDKGVEGHQAKLVVEGDELAVLQLGSEQGTTIDGERVLAQGDKETLRDGMRLGLGATTLEIRSKLA